LSTEEIVAISRHWTSYSATVQVHSDTFAGPTLSRTCSTASIIENCPRVMANSDISFSTGPMHSAALRKDSTARLRRVEIDEAVAMVGLLLRFLGCYLIP